MKELHFRGASDDTFGEVAVFNDDYDNCASGTMISWEVKDGKGNGMIVTGQYGDVSWPKGMPASWSIGVCLLDEGVPLPDWPMRFTTAPCMYSPELVIEAPHDVAIRCLNRV